MNSPDSRAARPLVTPSPCDSPAAPSTTQALSSDADAASAQCETRAEEIMAGDTARVMAALRGGCGAVVHWHGGGRDVRLTPAGARLGGGWVPAARLCATGRSDTVQVTLLRPELRAYVDGQRLLRLESPVLVRACQRLCFGADRGAGVAGLRCSSPPPLAGPASPPPLATPKLAQDGCLAASTPAPAATQTAVPFTPLSSHLSSCQEAPLRLEVTGAALTTVAAGGARVGPPAAAVHERQPTPQRPCVAALPTNAVREVPLTQTSSPAAYSVDVPPTGEKCTISAALSGPNSSDLAVEDSAAETRHTADVVDTAAAGGELADALTRTALPPPPPPVRASTACSSSLGSPSASARDATAVLERRRDEVLRDIFGKDGPPSPPRRTPRPQWTLDPVTDVRSPDWSALAAADAGVALGRPSGLYRCTCDGTSFGPAMAALRREHTVEAASAPRAGRSRGPVPPASGARGTVAGIGSAARVPSSSGDFALDFSDRTSIAAEPHEAALPAGLSALSWGGGGGALSRSVSAADMCSADFVRARAADAAALAACKVARQRREDMRVKMQLPPRVSVEPYVVEAFGASHRYRPLARLAELESATAGSARASSSPSSGASLSAPAPQRRPRAGHSAAPSHRAVPTSAVEKSATGPWQYPPAADELVSPRTEALLRGVLRRRGEASGAVADAAFVHCVLRRSYDAATDRFTYIGATDVTELLLTRFTSVLAALADRLRTSRPVLRVSAPVVCGGDLLGSFSDALMLLGNAAFFEHWSALHTPVLLLGNYVDVGWHSVEVCMLLCSWACLQPDMVHLLRGPHEDPAVNGCYRVLGKRCLRYKCRQRFGAARGIALWSQLNAVFALLPVAAIVDDSVFVAHGGVPLLHGALPVLGRRAAGRLRGATAGPTPRGRRLYSGTSESATRTTSPSAPPSLHRVSYRVRQGAPAASGGRYAGDGSDSAVSSVVRAVPRVAGARDAVAGPERIDTPATADMSDWPHHPADADVNSETPTRECPSCTSASPHLGTNGRTATCASASSHVFPSGSATRAGAEVDVVSAAVQQHGPAAVPGSVSDSRLSHRRSSPRSAARSCAPAPPNRAAPARSSSSRGASSAHRSGFTGSRVGAGSKAEWDDASWASVSTPEFDDTHELWKAVLEPTPSEDDFAALLDATTMQAYAFASLTAGTDCGGCSRADAAARRLQQRLVRELVWNRPRDAAAVLLPAEEYAMEGTEAGCDPRAAPWWRPHAVAYCAAGECRATGSHCCCRGFGATALVGFLRRFAFSLLLRGAPDETADFCGAALCEEGRLLSLSSCARQGRRARQAAACVVGPARIVRLATWGPQELADSLGQLSLSSLPGVREAEQERADFEQFVCDTLQARLREHRLVGPDNQWSVASAYEAFRQHRGEEGSECRAVVHPSRRRPR